ncbi:MAG TPA: hypothetical protein VFN30_08600 [Chitinophagaceae bacterium]|nr:hypothetical protein [Chitinophagaceae bacterium]
MPSASDVIDSFLPKIISFNVKASFKQNIVCWEADKDSSAVYYEIERSEDGLHFKTVGLILGAKPNYNNKFYFEFIDKIPKQKTKLFYRLRLINITGWAYCTNIIKPVNQKK